MSFKSDRELRAYAKSKYSTTAADIFEQLCKKRDHDFFWDGVARGLGMGSNSPNLSIGEELPPLYDDFTKPIESYGYVSFWLDFDVDFEFEERMDFDTFRAYLEDAFRIYTMIYPEERSSAKSYLDRALNKLSELKRAHEAWKKTTGKV